MNSFGTLLVETHWKRCLWHGCWVLYLMLPCVQLPTATMDLAAFLGCFLAVLAYWGLTTSAAYAKSTSVPIVADLVISLVME